LRFWKREIFLNGGIDTISENQPSGKSLLAGSCNNRFIRPSGLTSSWALDQPIHLNNEHFAKLMDARVKPGHDEFPLMLAPFQWLRF